MSKNNGKKSSFRPSFAIIHHYNSPNAAVTLDGKEVRREEKLWYSDYDDHGYPMNGRFIMCAAYSDHFIYTDPMWKLIPGRSHYMCTCGSLAVVLGYNAYKKDASPTNTGELLVCYLHASTGLHQTGGSRWV